MSYTGNKKAVIVGINYIGTDNELGGCIDDANNMYNFLLGQGFPEENIAILTDDQEDESLIPTSANITAYMQWLVDGAQEGDDLWFTYSGHGAQGESYNADEPTGIDSNICPVDFQDAGLLTDSEMHDVLVTPLPAGCRLFTVFDSCFSGTVLDLPYYYEITDGEPQEIQAADPSQTDEVVQEDSSAADVYSLSGCLDNQTSADSTFDGQAAGALTSRLLDILENNPEQTYLSLLQNLARRLEEDGFSQIPMMCTSHPTDSTQMIEI